MFTMFLLSMHIVIVTLISCAFFLVCLFSKKQKKKEEEETKEHQHSEDYTTAPEDLSVNILKLHGNILQRECFKDMGWWHFSMGS